MSARQKLNSAHINGSLIVAGVIGLGAQSWLVFLLALGVLVALATSTGGIRLAPRRDR